MAVGTLLTLLGGLAELAGIGLVALEIGRDRSLARRSLDAMEEPPSFRPPAPRPDMWSIEEFRRTTGPIETRVEAIRGDAQRQVNVLADAATRSAWTQDRAFRRFIQDQLEGGIRQRTLGVVLFSAGVVASTLGNVLLA